MTDEVFQPTDQPLIDTILSAVLTQGAWVVYYKHPTNHKSARLEIYQDLLKDWSLIKYSQTRKTQRFFKSFNEAVSLALKWMDVIEHQGLIKRVERGISQNFVNQFKPDTQALKDFSVWINPALEAFTQHNDWVDMASCLGLSADEYVDNNWTRFRCWLEGLHQRPHSDREIYAFGLAVWNLYRQGVLQ